MKKSISILILILSVLLSQAQWITQNPRSTSNDLNDIQFIDSDKGWIVGESGTILITIDGGMSWEKIESNTTQHLGCVNFITGGKGWIQGNDIILHSENGGLSWQAQVTNTNTNSSSISFTDMENGWAIGPLKTKWSWVGTNSYNALMRTSDGGNTWEPVLNIHDKIITVCFTDPLHGWILNAWSYPPYWDWGGDILFTDDGGLTYQEQYSGSFLRTIFFLDALHGWALSYNNVMITVDGGSTWLEVEENSGKDIFFADQQNGWIVGFGGKISRSSDGGMTWTDQNSGISKDLNASWFVDNYTGWAVGESGIILHTSDGGTNWVPQAPITFYNDLQSVFAINEQKVWIAGLEDNGAGTLGSTSNGGQAWDAPQVAGQEFTGVTFVNEYIGWASGSNSSGGFVQKTTDGGIEWEEQHSWSFPVQDLFFINEDIGWLLGSNSILKTTNGGNSWNILPYGNQPTLHSIFFIDEMHGWAVGWGGRLIRTIDGGENWEDRSFEFYHDLYDIFFSDLQRGWITGKYGILQTTDGGNNWMLNRSDFTIDIIFLDTLNGWTVGPDGLILKTTDGGQTWEEQVSGTSKNLLDADFSDLYHGWVVGESGTILYTDNGGATWITAQEFTSQTIKTRNYPNPFSNSTVIEYEIPEPGCVVIKVFNSTGMRINETSIYQPSMGTKTFLLQGTNLPAGIYYYQIQTGNRSGTGKMIIVR